jgi:hypothetical protein
VDALEFDSIECTVTVAADRPPEGTDCTAGSPLSLPKSETHDPPEARTVARPAPRRGARDGRRAKRRKRAGFGRIGRCAGEFVFLHNVAVDSAGNLYTADVGNGRRVQKFLLLKP